MKEQNEFIPIIKRLQFLRPGIPTYILFGGIDGISLLKLRGDLSNSKSESSEIDVILHSSGGSPAQAYRLIRTFREKYAIVNVIVPFWAKSAATLFAFGANRLVLHEFGELGPIDAQIKKDDDSDPDGAWSSALNVQSSLLQIEERSRQGMLEMFTKLRSKENGEIVKIGRKQLAEMLLSYSARFYEPLLQKIETVEIGVMARYLDIGKMYARRILKQYTDAEEEKISELLDFLVYECPDHGYVVDYRVIKAYLPSVMKSDQEPFSPIYDKVLGELSFMLMESDVPRTLGFLQDFIKDDDNDIVKNKENDKQQSEGIDQGNPSEGPSAGPGQDISQENPSEG